MKSPLASFIIGISIIISISIAAGAYKNKNRTHDIISVTGLGKKDFTSDLIVWKGSFNKMEKDLKAAYASLKADQEQVQAYLTSKGVKENEILFSAVSHDKEFNNYYDKEGQRHSEFLGYRLSQSVEIRSNEVDKIEAISREVTELINNGIEFDSYNPQYFYTKLAELKIEMIAEATEDARIRAEQIASKADADLGNLRYANMGVFQIIAQNSNEDYSWGGTYNTSSKNKTATITMKLQFGVD